MSTIDKRLSGLPLQPLKATLKRGEGPVQKLKKEAGDVLDTARKAAHLEVKQMTGPMGISESLIHRGLKSDDHLSFHRLWELPDSFWVELLIAIAATRQIAKVKVSIELEKSA